MGKNKISKVFHLFLLPVLLFFSLFAIYIIFALLLSLVRTSPAKSDCIKNEKMFIASNGVHLDIILPVKSLRVSFQNELHLPAGISYISFGWGDKDFYLNTPQWSDLTFRIAFNALFLKSETAMHVMHFRKQDENWKEICICRAQLDKLHDYIYVSFKKDSDSELIKIDVPGYFDNDFFYEAEGSYSLFRTCNDWSNNALKVADVPTSVWSPFDFGILQHFN